MFNLNIGLRIKELRERLSVNQDDFAHKLQVHKQTLSRYERKTIIPRTKVLDRICNLFNVNHMWLLTGKGEMFLSKESEPAIQEDRAPYNNVSDDINRKILQLLDGMPEEDRREALKHIQEKKLLQELMEERKDRKDTG